MTHARHSHSDIQCHRALCTYAILTGAAIDVGRLINLEMKAASDSRSNRALDFPVLITQLCHLIGVNVFHSNPTDILKLQPVITEKLFFPGEKVKALRGTERMSKKRRPMRWS